jgi:hypothetical protein
MKRLPVLIVFAALHFWGINLFGQELISGRVVDHGGSPIQAAAVYINGTTLRTSTSSNGAFELRGVRFPCKLVVSHLGYQTLKITLDSATKELPLLKLKEKDIALSEVLVEGKDKRKELLASFREKFLGNDTWGKAAVLLNEDALVFKVNYNEDLSPISFSGNLASAKLPDAIVERTLVAKAKEPLKIDLPKLGYTVLIDLDTFSFIRTKFIFNPITEIHVSPTEICQYMGSYSFIPYDSVSKTKQRRFERNREDAFYHSRMHFCQALYKKELLKNGYLLMSLKMDSVTNVGMYDWVNLDSCSRYDNKGNMVLYGLEGKQCVIMYFGHPNGSPVDLSKKSNMNLADYIDKYEVYYDESYKSYVYFDSDTCIVQSNGIVPNMSLLFSGKISEKKVGATLPDLYTPLVE